MWGEDKFFGPGGESTRLTRGKTPSGFDGMAENFWHRCNLGRKKTSVGGGCGCTAGEYGGGRITVDEVGDGLDEAVLLVVVDLRRDPATSTLSHHCQANAGKQSGRINSIRAFIKHPAPQGNLQLICLQACEEIGLQSVLRGVRRGSRTIRSWGWWSQRSGPEQPASGGCPAMRPKSRMASLPSVVRIRFPGCGSAWNKLAQGRA